MVRAKNPSLGTILDEMDAEHEAIHPAMEQLVAAATRWRADPAAAPTVLAALDALEAVLLPHLKHEEEQMMPLVEQTITQREWREWDQATAVRSSSTRDLAFTGHWLVDRATPDDFDAVTHEVPALPRFILLHLMGGAYERRRAACGRAPRQRESRRSACARSPGRSRPEPALLTRPVTWWHGFGPGLRPGQRRDPHARAERRRRQLHLVRRRHRTSDRSSL